jgi:hypothetical protein
VIEAKGLTNLHEINPENERYTYLFDGNLQALDNLLVTGGLMGPGTQFDVVHLNAEQPTGTFRGTDHDAIVARFFIEAPNEAPTNLVIDDNQVSGKAPAGTVVGTLAASDVDGDTLTYSLDNDGGGRFTVDPCDGRGAHDRGVRPGRPG